MHRYMVRGLLIVLALSLMVSCTPRGGPTQSDVDEALKISLKKLDGTSATLGELGKGKVVVLDFWASWCIYCKESVPEVNKLYEDYGSKGVGIYGINVQDSEAVAREFVKDNGIKYPVLLDTDGEVAQKFRILGIPALAVLDSEGRLKDVVHGVEEVEGILGKLLPGD